MWWVTWLAWAISQGLNSGVASSVPICEGLSFVVGS